MRKLIMVFTLLVLVACKEEKSTESIAVSDPVFTKEATLKILKGDGSPVQVLDVELATDDFERSTGLMYRKEMANNQGMLFIFEEEADLSFYMKSTYIPLDLIFLNSDGRIVNFHENAQALDESSILSEVPAQYVLEINAGLSEVWGLDISDQIVWE